MLRVTPIYGSRWSPQGQAEEPSCTLVEYGDCRVLWNVGWWPRHVHPHASPNGSSGIRSHSDQFAFPTLPAHDCLVLTDSTLQALGGLPMYYRQMKDTQPDLPLPPIYATFPTVKMGQMTLYDQHAAISLDGGQPPYTLRDLDDVFASVHAIKYSQAMRVYPRDTNTKHASLSVTAHRAGHVVGGAFYVVQRLRDETVVVLTTQYHVAKELHLDSSTILKHATTPDVLVTHPGGPALRLARSNVQHTVTPLVPPQMVTQVERVLVETVLSVLRRDGNVLLPCDVSGRVLEVLLALHNHWDRHRLAASYHLIWCGPMAPNVLDFARSQLEWMGTKLGHVFDAQAGPHPLTLPHVHVCTNTRELEKFLAENPNPACVVASGLSLEGGPARDLLLSWADNVDNAILFTDASQAYLRQHTHSKTEMQANPTAIASTPDEDQIMADAMVEFPIDASSVAVSTTKYGTNQADVTALTAVAPLAGSTTIVPVEDETTEDVDAGLVGTAVTEPSPWTTAGQLLRAWFEAKSQGREMDDVVQVDVWVPHKSVLTGPELAAFLAQEEASRRRQALEEEQQAMLREVELAKGQLRLGEDEATSGGAGLASSIKAMAPMRMAAPRPRKKSRFDSSLFLKFSKPLHLTFEVREEAVGIGQVDSTSKYGIGESVGRSGDILEDDYGIAVIPERFTDIVSGVDPSKFATGSGRIGDEVLRRGFGYGVDGQPGGQAKRSKLSALSSVAARVSEDEDQDDADDMDEQAMEAVDLSEGHGIVRGRNGRPPTKITTVARKVEVLAEINYIPLEGRVEARAARQSVRALQPREVIVLGGASQGSGDNPENLTDEVTVLAKATKAFTQGMHDVRMPSDGEVIELKVGHAAYAVRLIDTPYHPLKEREAADLSHEPIESFEAKVGMCTVSVLNTVATGQKVAADGSIVLAPKDSGANDDPSIYLSDGDVLLTDLRAELIAKGMKAEYSTKAGVAQLVVNGKVLVQKAQDSGQLEVEGPLCEDFYLVRGVVCGQFTVV